MRGESDNLDVRVEYVNDLDKRRRGTAITMFLVIGAFLVSIALSLSGMARTGLYETALTPTKPDITNPVFSMLFGIVFFVVSISTSKMSLKTSED